MAVKNEVSFHDFSRALKLAYVDVGKRQITGAGNAVTAEGIFVITGVEATEVERMLRSDIGSHFDLDAQAPNPLPQVLNAWHMDGRYTGPYGVLRDLEFTRPGSGVSAHAKGEGGTFSDLVATYCPGVPPRALLDELIRTGCVKDVGNGFYRAVSRSYVPDPLSDESIRLVAQVVHNLCETLEVNLRPEARKRNGSGRIQRTVYARHGVPPEALKRFEKILEVRGQVFADEIDDWFGANQSREGTQGAIKTGIGFYHYVVNDEDEREFSKELPTEGT